MVSTGAGGSLSLAIMLEHAARRLDCSVESGV